jgi:Dynamin family
MATEQRVSQRLRDLKRRLKQENPILENVVDSFRELDRISRRLGFFDREESHANRTSWWPLISVLGVYSSGKSSFINHFLGYPLQATGNQAVDDKFTVICFTDEESVRVLPGLALDADPRFPFFRMSRAIDVVSQGEGRRIDAYLQLKTCPSEKLRGRIMIDSPGFDADAQRTSTLRITDHIIELSDLVLVFFDARHPESGSMHDTLEHLVRRPIGRRDANKFLYVLNQLDATVQEDNSEEVFASWQRALAQSGLTAGCCYAIYIPELAASIPDAAARARYESKRDANLRAIGQRIERVGVERAYRIVGMLEQTAHFLENETVVHLQRFLAGWRRLTLWADGAVFGCLLALFLAGTIYGGYWEGLTLRLPLWNKISDYPLIQAILIAALVGAGLYVHFAIRRWGVGWVARRMASDPQVRDYLPNYMRAFRKNSRWFRSIFRRHPTGWSRRSARRLSQVAADSQRHIQKLNDMYTNPSGEPIPFNEPMGALSPTSARNSILS